MATCISLNDQTFWALTVSHPVKPRRVCPSQPPTSRSQGATLPALSQNTPPSNDAVVISSNEESDSNDIDDDDDEADSDGSLPSIEDIVSRLNRSECNDANTAGEQPQPVLAILMEVNVFVSRSSSELCYSA